jgi:hypothetical protein
MERSALAQRPAQKPACVAPSTFRVAGEQTDLSLGGQLGQP